MAHKKILDFLIKKEKFPLQIRVEKSLYERADKLRKKKQIKWVELIEAFLKQFIEEESK